LKLYKDRRFWDITAHGFVISNRRLEELVASIFKVVKEDITEDRGEKFIENVGTYQQIFQIPQDLF
jgi:ribosomal protein S16